MPPPTAYDQGMRPQGPGRPKAPPSSWKAKELPPLPPPPSAHGSQPAQITKTPEATQTIQPRNGLTHANFNGAAPPLQPARMPVAGAFDSPTASKFTTSGIPSPPPPAHVVGGPVRRDQPVVRAVPARKPVNVHRAPVMHSQDPSLATTEAATAGRAAAAKMAQAPLPRAYPSTKRSAEGKALQAKTMRPARPVEVSASVPRERMATRYPPRKVSQQRELLPLPQVEKRPAEQVKRPGFFQSMFAKATPKHEPHHTDKESFKDKLFCMAKPKDSPPIGKEIGRPVPNGRVFIADLFQADPNAYASKQHDLPLPPRIADLHDRDSACTTVEGLMLQASGRAKQKPKRPARDPSATQAKFETRPPSRPSDRKPEHRQQKSPQPLKREDSKTKHGGMQRFRFERYKSDNESVLSFQCRGTEEGESMQQPYGGCQSCCQHAVLQDGLCRYCLGNNQSFQTNMAIPNTTLEAGTSSHWQQPTTGAPNLHRARKSVRPASSVYSERPLLSTTVYTPNTHDSPSEAAPKRKPRPAPLSTQAANGYKRPPYDVEGNKELVSPASPCARRRVKRHSTPISAASFDSFSDCAFLKDDNGNWLPPPDVPVEQHEAILRKSFWQR